MAGSENSAAKRYRTDQIPPSESPESQEHPTAKHSMVVPKGSDVLYTHPAADLESVMEEVLRLNPDHSFCFLNEGRLRDRVGLFRENFLPNMQERRVIYAMKANPRGRILEILSEEGIDGFDCASLNEVSLALDHTGPEGVYYNHPIKKKQDVYMAHQQGVRYFTVQSRSGIEKLMSTPMTADAREVTDVAVRVSTPNDKAAIDLSTDKFGVSPALAMHCLEMIRHEGFRPGLSMNTGSQNPDPYAYHRGISLLASIAEYKGHVNSVNLGGGMPINYSKRDRVDLRNYVRFVSDSVRKEMGRLFGDRSEECKVIVEPGRSMVADSVDLVIPVLEIDEWRHKRGLHIDDGIFTSFSDKAVHDWGYHYDVLTKDHRQLPDLSESYLLYGRTCDSGDTLGEVRLPSGLREGDYIWVKNAGAYMDSQASIFNGFEPPQYVSYNT